MTTHCYGNYQKVKDVQLPFQTLCDIFTPIDFPVGPPNDVIMNGITLIDIHVGKPLVFFHMAVLLYVLEVP